MFNRVYAPKGPPAKGASQRRAAALPAVSRDWTNVQAERPTQAPTREHARTSETDYRPSASSDLYLSLNRAV